MKIYTLKYTEHQQREWYIEIEAESVESAGDIFEANGEDVWLMVGSKKLNGPQVLMKKAKLSIHMKLIGKLKEQTRNKDERRIYSRPTRPNCSST